MGKLLRSVLWKRRWVFVFLACVVFFPVLQAEQARSEVLRMAKKHSDATTLNPHLATGSQDRIVVEMIFSGLLRYRPGTISADSIEPDLAKSIPVAKTLPDGKQVWIFNLREGVFCHPYGGKPGYEITSEDVVFSLNRAADAKKSAFSSDYAGMTVEAQDKYTVKITLEKAISPILFLPKVANHAGGLIVLKKAVTEMGEEAFKMHPVGTGPFMFSSYKPMEKIVLVRHPKFFRGAAKLDGIEFYYMPDVSSRELGLQKGELDVIEGPREEAWGKKMEALPGLVVDTIGSEETIMAHFNMTKKPLDSLKVRQAIAYALDRREFVSYYGEKMASPIYSPVPLKVIGSLTKEEAAQAGVLYEYDPAKAKKLLEEAGYPKGFSLEVFTSESDSYRGAYELMQAQLRKVGINLNLSVVDHTTFHKRVREDLDPIVVYVAERPNPDAVLSQSYLSDSIVVSGKKPVTNFSHMGAIEADGQKTDIDDLILAARVEPDPKKQVKLWKEAQVKILKVMAAYPFVDLGYLFARKSTVDWGYKMVVFTDGPKATEKTQFVKKK
jgi:peptide/nickel transport system substrate-binding protein